MIHDANDQVLIEKTVHLQDTITNVRIHPKESAILSLELNFRLNTEGRSFLVIGRGIHFVLHSKYLMSAIVSFLQSKEIITEGLLV